MLIRYFHFFLCALHPFYQHFVDLTAFCFLNFIFYICFSTFYFLYFVLCILFSIFICYFFSALFLLFSIFYLIGTRCVSGIFEFTPSHIPVIWHGGMVQNRSFKIYWFHFFVNLCCFHSLYFAIVYIISIYLIFFQSFFIAHFLKILIYFLYTIWLSFLS